VQFNTLFFVNKWDKCCCNHKISFVFPSFKKINYTFVIPSNYFINFEAASIFVKPFNVELIYATCVTPFLKNNISNYGKKIEKSKLLISAIKSNKLYKTDSCSKFIVKMHPTRKTLTAEATKL
jgi:hypothetical protein